ncbi:MAG: KilA-N domain-containing protein [Vibrio splendidus]
MNELKLRGSELVQDENGRISLNQLHKLSERSDMASRAPNKWLEKDTTKELVAECQSQYQDLIVCDVTKGGVSPGTFAHKELAVSYAGWLHPKFALEVNRVFLAYKSGELQEQGFSSTQIESQMSGYIGRLEEVINRKLDEVKIRSEVEMKPCVRYMSESSPATIFDDMRHMAGLLLEDETAPETILAAQMLEKTTGYNPYTLAGKKMPVNSPMGRSYVTPTEIGIFLGGYSGKGINNALVRLKFQEVKVVDNRNFYRPTEKGVHYWALKDKESFTNKSRWGHDLIPELIKIFESARQKQERKVENNE